MAHILVRSGLTGDEVALWEREPSHPGGEIFVAGAGVVEVAMTPAVARGLQQGRLVEVRSGIIEPAAARGLQQLPADVAQTKRGRK